MDEMKNTMQETTENVAEVEAEVTEVVEAAEPAETMADYEAEIAASLKKIKNGDLVEGEIIGVNDKEVLVNFGYISDGIIPASEMPLEPEQKPNEKYQVGDKVKAEILRTDDGSGNVELSISRASAVEGWQLIEKAFDAKEPLQVKVVQAIKGGVLCEFMGIRGFMPASLSSAFYIEDLNDLVDQVFPVLVLELDRNTNRVVFSRKELEREQLQEQREQMFETVKHGDTFTGVVKKIMDFGVFVNIGPVDGLVRTEDLSWEHVTKAEDVVSEGQEVTVYVLEVDRAKKKIRLGMKDKAKDPWNNVDKDYTVGESYEGKVMRIKDFGAFVALPSGVEGLIHLSQISDKHIKSPDEVLKVGDEINVRVLEVNKDEKRIRLTMKSADAAPKQPREPRKSHAPQKRESETVATATNTEAMTSLQSAFDNIDLKDFKN
ncbi:30S ribosomal protein S1 [Clostridiales bacterium COT073_COT-073]|nr:30S ribosomal protein S1 [Clostridiales bacterium COT073_COT-073]